MSDPQQLREKIARQIIPTGWDETYPEHHRPMIRDLAYQQADNLLPLVSAEKRDAWGEACMAIAWALDNGPTESAAAYVASNNPYLEGSDDHA